MQQVIPTIYAIPDADCTGESNPVTITGMPKAVPSFNIQPRINISHPYDGDLAIFLISPVLNIYTFSSSITAADRGFNFTVYKPRYNDHVIEQLNLFTISGIEACRYLFAATFV